MVEEVKLSLYQLGNYVIESSLPMGNYYSVKLGQHRQNKNTFTIKILYKKKDEREENYLKKITQFQNEITILQLLQNQQTDNYPILKLLEYKSKDEGVLITRQRSCCKVMYSVSEPIVGDLIEHIYLEEAKEVICRTYFHQLIEGLQFCHQNKVYLLNLRPDYIFLDQNFQLKFGNLCIAEIGNNEDELIDSSLLEKNEYSAPEIWNSVAFKGASADIFSCGIILFLMYFGATPFERPISLDKYYRLIIDKKFEQF